MTDPYIAPNQSFSIQVGTYFNNTLSYIGTAPFTWNAVGLPTGLDIDPATGIISGVPTTIGKRTAYTSLTDINGQYATVVKFYVESPSGNNVFFQSFPTSIGYAGVTNFQFTTNVTQVLSSFYVVWSFGDGSISTEINPSHIYHAPGKYNVNLQIYPNSNNTSLKVLNLSSTLVVNLLLNESIYFDYTPPPTFSGHINRYPFVINFTSSIDGPHYIDLAAQFSRSYENQNPQNKWSFLRPQWRFLDLDGNLITGITPQQTPIYTDSVGVVNHDPNGFFAGVTGTASFYFVDDIYNFDLKGNNKPYTTLIATLQTSAVRSFGDSFNLDNTIPSFNNSLATVSYPYQVLWRNPDNISIKENGVRDYVNPRWPTAEQPIVATLNYTSSYPDSWVDGNGVSILNPSFNFSHNIPVETSPVKLQLGSIGFSSNFVPQPTQMVWIDNTGYKTPGYYKGVFYTNTYSSLNALITAQLTYTTPVLSAQFASPKFWVSNPEAGMMATFEYIYSPSLSAAFNTPNLNIAQVHSFNMPVIDTVDFTTDAMAVSGFHGINSIAALPFPSYAAWVADSEMNLIYKLNTMGTILCAIDLNAVVANNSLGFLVSNQVSPVAISLDSKQNIWVTLHDTVSTLKFDSVGNFLFATTPLSATGSAFPPAPNIDPIWYDQNSYYLYDKTSPYDCNHLNNIDLNFIEPTGLCTDTKDNVWVSYSNYASGYLVKYDSNGGLLYSFSYPVCSCPQNLIVDNQDNVWIALSNNIWNSYQCTLEKRDSFGNILSSIYPIRGLNKLTLDSFQNPWFTFSYSWIGSINNKTGQIFTTNLSGTGNTKNSADWFNPNINTDETALEGIGCDGFGRVYVINSVENQVYVLDSSSKKFLNKFYLNPHGFTFYMADQASPTLIESSAWSKSAQADGDWTGLNWFSKYGYLLPGYSNSTQTITITGQSVPLNFLNFTQTDIFKVNENFDLAGDMQSLAFTPTLAESNFLFENFFGSIYGKYPFQHSDVGVKMYEKIANYVSNIADIDYCNLNQLYDNAEKVGIDLQNFQLNYPIEIERVIDFSSINTSRLLGARSVQETAFKVPNAQGNLNLKPNPINSLNYQVTAGIPLVLKDRSLNQYRIINTGYIGCSQTYTLNVLANYLGLTNPNWPSYYEFHEFVHSYDNTQIAGIIDWDNPQTTINETLSTLNDWFGSGKYLDTQFSYELYNGLGLLN